MRRRGVILLDGSADAIGTAHARSGLLGSKCTTTACTRARRTVSWGRPTSVAAATKDRLRGEPLKGKVAHLNGNCGPIVLVDPLLIGFHAARLLWVQAEKRAVAASNAMV